MTQPPPGDPRIPNPFSDISYVYDPYDPYADALFVAAVANVASAALNTMLAASQSSSQMLLDAARHSSATAIEELAIATKGANVILDSDPSGNGSDPAAKRLKKIYRLLKKCARPSGAPVVT